MNEKLLRLVESIDDDQDLEIFDDEDLEILTGDELEIDLDEAV